MMNPSAYSDGMRRDTRSVSGWCGFEIHSSSLVSECLILMMNNLSMILNGKKNYGATTCQFFLYVTERNESMWYIHWYRLGRG